MQLNIFRLLLFSGLLGTFLFVGNSFAQSFNFEEDWRWSHFTTESGLPTNKIAQIEEAKDGTLWAVGIHGLAWFDGYNWIKVDSKNGLPSEQILGINYSGLDSLTLVCFANKTFWGNRDYFHPFKNIQKVLSIAAFQKGYILINENYELHFYQDGSSWKLRENTYESFPNRYGDIWFTSDSGLYFLSHDGETTRKLFSNTYIKLNKVVENIQKNGMLVIERPMELEGIWEWDSTRSPNHNVIENGKNVITFAINDRNDVICVYKTGLVRIRQNNNWFTPSYVPSQLKESKRLFFDKNGNLWIASDAGIYVFRSLKTLWINDEHISFDLKGNINEILPLKNGDLWLGTGNGIVIKHKDGTQKWIPEIDGEKIGAITGLAQSKDGIIWISSGSSFSGTYSWDNKHWRHNDIGKNPKNTMIHKIKTDKHGNLWFLGLSRQGYQPKSEQPGVFLYQDSTFIPWGDIHHLPSKRVYSFSEGPDSTYWFATNTGIYKWKGLKDTLDDWQQWSMYESGLLAPSVFTLAANEKGELWFGHGIGLVSYGLGKIDTIGSISYYTIKDGLIEDHVIDLAFDEQETLWITTDGGLSSYRDGIWTTLGKNTGLIYPVLWPVKPLSDKVYVGTVGGGLAILNRKALTSVPLRISLSTPYVEESKVYLTWKTFGFMGIPSQENILTRYNLNNNGWSSWSTNHSLSMYNLEPGNYTFHVQARDIYGQFVENGSHASFTILPPLWKRPIFFLPSTLAGIAFLFLSLSYYVRKRRSDIALRKSEEKFRVVSETTPSAIFIFNESSILYANPAAIQLTGYQIDALLEMKIQDIIHPQYHHLFNDKNTIVSNLHHTEINLIQFDRTEHWIEIKTNKILFQGDDAILAAMFDVTERKNSEYQLRTLAFELSRTEERERRHLASYLHDTISQNLAFLKLKFRTFAKSSPEPEQKVEEMKAIIENLIQDSQTLTFELSPPILVELGLKAALDWLSERILERHGIQCIVHYHVTALISYEIQSLLFHSIQELTTNVVKHAKATQIIISVATSNSSTVIIVQDNGIGFNKIPSSQTIGKTNGFGLFHIRQRISALGGTLKFQFAQPTGSQVIISIPYIHTEGSLE